MWLDGSLASNVTASRFETVLEFAATYSEVANRFRIGAMGGNVRCDHVGARENDETAVLGAEFSVTADVRPRVEVIAIAGLQLEDQPVEERVREHARCDRALVLRVAGKQNRRRYLATPIFDVSD
jgi:hypothetical protein